MARTWSIIWTLPPAGLPAFPAAARCLGAVGFWGPGVPLILRAVPAGTAGADGAAGLAAAGAPAGAAAAVTGAEGLPGAAGLGGRLIRIVSFLVCGALGGTTTDSGAPGAGAGVPDCGVVGLLLSKFSVIQKSCLTLSPQEGGVNRKSALEKRFFSECFLPREKPFRVRGYFTFLYVTNLRKECYKLFKKNFLKHLADSSLHVLRFQRCSGNLPVSGWFVKQQLSPNKGDKCYETYREYLS